MDHAVKEVIDNIFERTLALLEDNRDLLESSAAELLERETLEDADLNRAAFQRGASSPSARSGPCSCNGNAAWLVLGMAT